MSTTSFALPDEGDILARIIEVIPSSWAWIDGHLDASSALVASGQVAEKSGFDISRWHSIRPTIGGPWNHEKNCADRPDLAEILIERKLPRFIRFTEAGFQEHTASFLLAQKVAVHFLRRAYRGWFSISAGCYDNNKHENPAYLEMRCSRTTLSTLFRSNWSLEVGLHSRFGGKPEMIGPIIAACQTLGLQPLPAQAEQNPPP